MPRVNDTPAKQQKRCPMTRFRVHLCATPWTVGQARRRRVRVIPDRRHRSPLVRLKAKSRAQNTHTQLTVGMNE